MLRRLLSLVLACSVAASAQETAPESAPASQSRPSGRDVARESEPGAAPRRIRLFGITIERSKDETTVSRFDSRGFGVRAVPLREVIARAYDVSPTVVKSALPVMDERFTVEFSAGSADPTAARRILQDALVETFDLQIENQVRQNYIWVLAVRADAPPKLERGHGPTGGIGAKRDGLTVKNRTMRGVADWLEQTLGERVLDETELKGWYDFEVTWQDGAELSEALPEALREQVGLELTRAKRAVDVLVVGKRGAD